MPRRPLAALALALAACLAGGACRAREETAQATAGYLRLRAEMEGVRAALAAADAGAADPGARASVRARARGYLAERLVRRVLPAWDGTAWAMDGTSSLPQQGHIACGHFVTTTLAHAGLRVDRFDLGQQAAEDIILSLVAPADVARFSNRPLPEFLRAVVKRGDGLYIVGLDYHVGFLEVEGGEVWFHHASYLSGRRVIRERAVVSPSLSSSHYRVVGKLFADDRLVDAWLRGAPIPTTLRRPRPARTT